ncbi:GspE/PulE family protein [Ramlibacter humi]
MIGRFRGADTNHAPEGLCAIFLDSLDLQRQQWFEFRLEATPFVERYVVEEPVLARYLDSVEERVRVLDSLHVPVSPPGQEARSPGVELSLSGIEGETNSVVRLVNSTLYDALRSEASDIHLEQHREGLHVKYRIDGVLHLAKSIEGGQLIAEQAISRIKVLADLDISERRIPQDGRFKIVHGGRDIDLRVSIMPSLFGEDAVLRVLDRKHIARGEGRLTLDALGFDEATKRFVRRSAKLPYGLLLVTGPTGSGKTTTLYAALSEIYTGEDKIITIEDPIEYQLSGILQIPVNEKKGLTFARGLRSILRHDPDKIMVGEIRDSDTAHVAVQAALTGHQVLTTVHANNVFDVIGRFANMGVDTYSFVSALTGVMAQRLVRTLCPKCARPAAGGQRLAVGCEHCRGSGYKGRRALAEVLPMDDELRDLLVNRASITRIKQQAVRNGFSGLRACALQLVADGATTLEEAERIAPEELA